MAINGQAAGGAGAALDGVFVSRRERVLLASTGGDEREASANVDQINDRTARLPWERTALSATLDDLRGMDWRRELALNGSIGGSVLA
jgi:hypothetical protein